MTGSAPSCRRRAPGKPPFSEAAEEAAGGVSTRGGDLVQIIASASGLIAALSPIVIAWIRGRGLEVEEKIETRTDGSVVRTLRVKRKVF